MAVLAIGADSAQLGEFISVFGMRFLGMLDPSSATYNRWRVPNPTAPYPQDYILDQQGIVRYWNDAYDPQAVMQTIDRLLATGVGEARSPESACAGLRVETNPVSSQVVFRIAGSSRPGERIIVSNALGRRIASLLPEPTGRAVWNPDAPTGVYFARRQSDPRAPGVSFILSR